MRCWLVEREYDDKGLVRLVYATPDGSEHVVQERSANMLSQVDVTAAREVDPERLEPVEDDETRGRYSAEAERMREHHDPDDTV